MEAVTNEAAYLFGSIRQDLLQFFATLIVWVSSETIEKQYEAWGPIPVNCGEEDTKVLSICRDIDIGRTTFVNMLPNSDAPTHMAMGSNNIVSARLQAFGLIVQRLMLQLGASVVCKLLQSFLFLLQLRNTCCTYHHLLQFEAVQILAVVAFVVPTPRLQGDLLPNKLNRTATQATVLCLMDDVMANSWEILQEYPRHVLVVETST